METETQETEPAEAGSGGPIGSAREEGHRRLIAKARNAIPAYASLITPQFIRERTRTSEGRIALREVLGDLSREAAAMREMV